MAYTIGSEVFPRMVDLCTMRSVGLNQHDGRPGAQQRMDHAANTPRRYNTRLASMGKSNHETLLAAAQAERDRFQLLLDINNAVVTHLDLTRLLHATSDSLRKVVAHDAAAIALYDPQNNQLRLHTFDLQYTNQATEGTLLPLEGTPEGLAFRTQRPIVIPNLDLKEFPSSETKKAYDDGLRSGCIIPLLVHDRAVGTLVIASLRENAFTGQDAELLTHIARQIAIAVDNALAYREIAALKNKLASEKVYLEEEIKTEYNFEEIVGRSNALKHVLQQVEIVAATDSVVLIHGETGTGKELIARAIHNLSARRERTMVKLNCAAIPMGLLESELFGHEKGAFTGAVAPRVGRFELAHRGTLLLDEVGEIPLELQPKLLRVLQEQEFERLGSSRTIKTDVRLITATNCDLQQMVAEKKFRSDLYYRLNVFPVFVPPLRERVEDIPLLVSYFAQKHARRMKKTIEAIPTNMLEKLCQYSWPGNVRELENLIERAVILSSGPELHVTVPELSTGAASIPAEGTGQNAKLQDAERTHILRILNETNWIIGGPRGAASKLGLNRSTLRSKMIKLGISRPS
jgi:formate hydrogenlyase transcriptional activator